VTKAEIINTYNEVVEEWGKLFGDVDYKEAAIFTADSLGVPYQVVKEAIIEGSVKFLGAG